MTAAPNKAMLRAEARARRDAIAGGDPAAARAAAEAAARNFMAAIAIPPGTVVSVFSSFRGELDTGPLRDALLAAGAVVALPVVVAPQAPLVFRRWSPETGMMPGRWGILEPPPSAPEVIPAIVVLPLLAFDPAGHRLGYGGGFYDRTLEHLRATAPVMAVGLAYSAQMFPALPAESHDIALDCIVTEEFAQFL
ncbi:5-formyltetrahydrofolate cyclo-ligase [Oceanibacterium hippocampi]|uniref:5-formyltetrahydrofolate cyclo-ligase n=1 Tax=Oceanibacterium hippocampi TaxID=745714 RepID=A0A1Y5TV37_9PROT|nr:5-formyltetrahydrofolate cyclo-ligase [Oceanibacterium hippocampi]SLN73398.1 putative 5-formyltetrahydrofolate cyclo-ligase [Oceanibacterium hippocampi]